MAGAAWAWLIAEAVISVLAVIIALRVLKRPFEGMARVVAVIFLSAGLGATLGWLVTDFFGGVAGLVVGSLISLVGGLAVLLTLDRLRDFGLIRDFSKAFPQIARKVGLGDPEI